MTLPFGLNVAAAEALGRGPEMRHYVEAVAVELADEIRGIMETSTPSGRTYRIPDTEDTYVASAPGEPPAIRLNTYAAAWRGSPAVLSGTKITAAAVNDRRTEDGKYAIGELLELGTERMKPRPHISPALVMVANRSGGRLAVVTD